MNFRVETSFSAKSYIAIGLRLTERQSVIPVRTVASLGHEGAILTQDEFSGTDHCGTCARDDT